MPDLELHVERPPPDSRLRPETRPRRIENPGNPVGRGRELGQARSAKDLVRTLVEDITPVLQREAVRLHCAGGRNAQSDPERPHVFRAIDVAEFTTLAVCPDCDLWVYVERAVAFGASADEILENLLAPAARRLGDLWAADDCDFFSVTTAAHRLQTAVRRLSHIHSTERQGRPRALLVPAPGETHVLGLEIVRGYFEKCGWSVDLAIGGGHEAALRRHWYELVAFSISCDRFVDALAEAMARVRKISRNRNVYVLVGGPVVAARPGLAAKIGADAGAATPQEAVAVTRSLLSRSARL